MNFRYLGDEQKYKSWQWIEVETRKYESDPRLCSYEIRQETLRVVGSAPGWDERFRFIRPLLVPNHEVLNQAHEADFLGVSMAAIEIRCDDFECEPTSSDWSPSEREKLSQELLFDKRKPLMKVPYNFKLHFHCAGGAPCGGHAKSILWWDLQQSFLNWREQYGESETLERMRSKVMLDMDPTRRIPIVLLGTLRHYLHTWCIGGLFNPPRGAVAQGALF